MVIEPPGNGEVIDWCCKRINLGRGRTAVIDGGKGVAAKETRRRCVIGIAFDAIDARRVGDRRTDSERTILIEGVD